MLPDPSKVDKYIYTKNTKASSVRFVYAFGLISWFFVFLGYSGSFFIDPFFSFFVLPCFSILTTYHVISFGINLFYRGFNEGHHDFLKKKFQEGPQPSVDIFLPICGEDIEILQNTWTNVANIDYGKKKVYVLDDSKTKNEDHKKLAEAYGFTYIERPNKGEMKKAGNLKYAYERSDGDFIVIFDADFSPKREFLLETLPVIMSDPLIGILQTPQYFGTSADISPRGSLEYGASYTQEDFYRVIQVARDSLGAPLCCGSNALYRRKALDTIGGTVQIEHSEDAHTGFALLSTGWKVRYLPLVLAIGLCPDHLHPYFMQQHRWASGSMALMSSSKFWRSPLSIKQKLCFITGFLYYIQHPVSLIFSFQLFWTLFIYSDYLNFLNALPFYPYIFFSFVVMPLFKIHPLKFGAFYASIVQLYSYSHAVLSVITKTYTAWVPTNGKHLSLSSSFISSRRILSVYVSIYTLLLFVAIRTGDVYLFSPNFWSIQFWIAWNLFFSYFLLFKMHRESYL